MKFEIEDIDISTKKITVTILKDGFFSKDIIIYVKDFFDFVIGKENNLLTKNLYDYIENNNLVPEDIVEFEN